MAIIRYGRSSSLKPPTVPLERYRYYAYEYIVLD
jgi:hypothetical protein